MMSPLRKRGPDASSPVACAPLPPLTDLAQPYWLPPGENVEIRPQTRSWWNRSDAAHGAGLRHGAEGKLLKVDLPPGARMSRYALRWSPTGRLLALVLYRNGPGELWLVDATDGKARH